MASSSTSVAFRGSCACGRITYACTAIPTMAQNCQCVTCRKLSGGPYKSFLDVPAQSITYVDHKSQDKAKGQARSFEGFPQTSTDGIVIYRFSEVAIRAFCAECHTSLGMTYHHLPDVMCPSLGTVDEDTIRDEEVKLALTPKRNIYTSQRPWWVGMDSKLPEFSRFLPEAE